MFGNKQIIGSAFEEVSMNKEVLMLCKIKTNKKEKRVLITFWEGWGWGVNVIHGYVPVCLIYCSRQLHNPRFKEYH